MKSDGAGKPPWVGKARIELFGHRDLGIAGTSHHQDVLRKIAGDALTRGEHVAFTALIVPEPENEYDPNAIAVVAEGFGLVGYFGRRDAVRYRASGGAASPQRNRCVRGVPDRRLG